MGGIDNTHHLARGFKNEARDGELSMSTFYQDRWDARPADVQDYRCSAGVEPGKSLSERKFERWEPL